ncbi:hypothetical protein [Mycobacterium sp.]|uniref:hypothetical protein n=1 Tax=Mycobacterium sp. TaxID=1785 RepID=UPI003C72F7D3
MTSFAGRLLRQRSAKMKRLCAGWWPRRQAVIVHGERVLEGVGRGVLSVAYGMVEL